MSGLEIRELECFLVLADELHFGRAGERLYVSQSRVSQLLRSLESRIGARLVDRTSRRVRLTPLGQRFLTGLRPAYEALRNTVEETRAAARGVEGVIRLGFQGVADEPLLAGIELFHTRHPDCVAEYLPAERLYIAEVQPMRLADLVIDNSTFDQPRILP